MPRISESDIQKLRTEFQGLEKRLTDRFDREMDDVKKRLDKIEDDIGSLSNGKPGIGVRLDRLENSQESKKNLVFWIIIPLPTVLLGSFLGAFLGHYFSLLEK